MKTICTLVIEPLVLREILRYYRREKQPLMLHISANNAVIGEKQSDIVVKFPITRSRHSEMTDCYSCTFGCNIKALIDLIEPRRALQFDVFVDAGRGKGYIAVKQRVKQQKITKQLAFDSVNFMEMDAVAINLGAFFDRLNLPAMNPSLLFSKQLPITAEIFQQLFAPTTWYAAGVDDVRPAYNGLLLTWSDCMLQTAATNGHRFARKQWDFTETAVTTGQTFVPITVLRMISKLVNITSKRYLRLLFDAFYGCDDHLIWTDKLGFTVCVRTQPDLRFLGVGRLISISQEHSWTLTLNRYCLLDMLANLGVKASTAETKLVKISPSGQLALYARRWCHSPDNTLCQLSIDAVVTGPLNQDVFYEARDVMALLTALQGSEITLRFTTQGHCAVQEQDDWHIIMATRN